MKKNILLITSVILSYISFSQSVLGTWKTIDDNTGKERSNILVYKSGDGKVYGKITKITDPTRQTAKCTECKGDKKDKPIMGMLLVEGLTQNGNEYSGGTITDPDTGKVYDCKIWLEGEDLKVRGYLGWFYRTQTWKKVN